MYSDLAADPGPAAIAGLAELLRAPSAVRYIKLGQGGAWAPRALDQGVIPFGFRRIDHQPCADGDWDEVRGQLVRAGRSPSGVTHGLRELRDFYELDDQALWVTFADGHLQWAFAEPKVVPIPDSDEAGPRRFRRTLGGWSRSSLAGEPLAVRSLSSSLTRVAGFRQTICTVGREDYLLRRIRGEEEPLLTEARRLADDMAAVAGQMIAALDWRDFEILVDLLFARGGWRRQSALGNGEVDIDLLLDNPSTGETAWVQVKSSAGQAVLDDYLERFRRNGGSGHFFFVCHSPRGTLTLPAERGLHLWAGDRLARAAVAAGMFDWLIERTR